MQFTGKIYRLQGVMQHYDWGGTEFLPSLLHIPNPEHKPYAEYWLGAHDRASAEVILPDNTRVKLNELINHYPVEILGKWVYDSFGRLPYLLKILDVKDMLSIQVHPTKQAANEEFERENNRGIPIDASHRNYKDENHKPELMAALSEFWLLHGFKPNDKLVAILKSVPELEGLIKQFESGGYKGLYQTIMEMGQAQVNSLLQPLLSRIIPLYQQNQLRKSEEDFWAAQAALTFNSPDKIDRGIFSIYLFNLVRLKQDEAIFQDAGIPHAYLEGQNVEIMANSDNVLRGGLTNKHIDVNELMKHVKFQATHPEILHGKRLNNTSEQVFKTPAPDFELSCLQLDAGGRYDFTSRTAEILFLMAGEITVSNNGNHLQLKSAEAALIYFGQSVQLNSKRPSVLYKASVPVPNRA